MHQTPPIASVPKAALLVSLLVAGGLAGCVDQGNDECVDGVCAQGAKPGDSFVTNATRSAAHMDPCRGVIIFDDFPEGVVGSEVPPAFEPQGMFQGTERIQLTAMACDRMVVEGVVGEDVHFMYTGAVAQPRNHSWSTGFYSQYVFEMMVDHEAIASALAQVGIPVRYAAFESDVIPVPLGNRHSWSFDSGDIGFSFDFMLTDEGQGSGAGQTQVWFGANEYYRADENGTNTRGLYGGLTASTLVMEGNPAFVRMLGTQTTAMAGQTFVSLSKEWVPFSRPFQM